MLVACKSVATEFTDGPAAEQIRDWALEEGIYTGTDRAYSPEFRERTMARLADLIEAGAPLLRQHGSWPTMNACRAGSPCTGGIRP